MESQRRQLFHAALAMDGAGNRFEPGAVLLEGQTIVASGTPSSIGQVADASSEQLNSAIITPCFANAHAHLDLTHIGPRSFCGDFDRWIDKVRRERCADDTEIAASVELGVQASLNGGVGLVGDIAGGASPVPGQVRAGRLPGVSLLEIFGIGARRDAGVQHVDVLAPRCRSCDGGVIHGLQLHAPYSCDVAVYEAAAAANVALSSHVAETRDERRFTEHGDGPFAEFLSGLGLADGSIQCSGKHPIDHLWSCLVKQPWVLAHLNDIDDEHVAMLGASDVGVVYCPRASAYFGHPRDGESAHRYRAMIDAGVDVALGTDSVINLESAERISVLDDMRLLHRRDGVSVSSLLRMATVAGARVLGWDAAVMSLEPGVTLGLLAHTIDCDVQGAGLEERWMRDDGKPRWLAGPFHDDDWCRWHCDGV